MQEHDTINGHVYILTSASCEYVKIGGTDHAPLKRIREINGTSPYKELGPWTLHDFREVLDWRSVESHLHYVFRGKLVKKVKGQKELFSIHPSLASMQLNLLDEKLVSKKPAVDRLFQESELSNYLANLFRHAALLNWLDLQGAWTLSLFPSTAGGRYFTLNIGPHEVAYSTLPTNKYGQWNMVCMDRLIHDFPDVKKWLRKHNGDMADDLFEKALPRSTHVRFTGSLEVAHEFLNLSGVRRAVIAYWTESLIQHQERGSSSLYAKHHNWNAVAKLRELMTTNML